MMKRKTFLAVGAALIAMGFAGAASAAPLTLTITRLNDGVSLTVVDGGTGDDSVNANTIVVETSVLLARFNDLAEGSRASASSTQTINAFGEFAQIEQVAVLARNATGGTSEYMISLSQDGFVLPTLPLKAAQATIGGFFTATAGGATASFEGFVNPNNGLFAEEILVGSAVLGPFTSTGALQEEFGASSPLSSFMDTGTYSMTAVATYTVGALQQVNGTGGVAVIAAIPEPASVAMMGVGLVGVVGYGIRRRRRTA